MTKYNSTDGKAVLDTSDDAVQANWSGPWRMPTIEEYTALGNAVNTTWTNDYQGSGVAGRICTDKTDSFKVLFFPVYGRCYKGSVSSPNSGFCWSSSLYNSNVKSAYDLNFSVSSMNWRTNNLFRCNGAPVRGVAD